MGLSDYDRMKCGFGILPEEDPPSPPVDLDTLTLEVMDGVMSGSKEYYFSNPVKQMMPGMGGFHIEVQTEADGPVDEYTVVIFRRKR